MTYNARKAAQVVSFFILKNGGSPLHIVKAMKLVYLTDRKSLAKFGFPVLEETRVSMKHGPVNSYTYEIASGQVRANKDWDFYLKDRENHKISTTGTFCLDDLDELSEEDIEVMEAVWDEVGHMDEWRLRDWTHDPKNIPEWEDPKDSSFPIPTRRILESVDFPEAAEQVRFIESMDYIDRVFERKLPVFA